MGYKKGSLSPVELPTYCPPGIPRVFDDVSFALSMGLRNQTVWWLICKTTLHDFTKGTGTYDVFTIPKKRGGLRTIHAPKRTLKRVQKVLLRTYFDPLPAGDWVGAYVLGRDMVYSVNKHTGKDVVISLDLRDFFGATKRSWVQEWIRSLGYPPEVSRVMAGLVTVPVPSTRGVRYCVPQGAPTSGAVTNHVASARLDLPLLAFLESRGLADCAYTRYADDLTISFNGFLPVDEFRELMSGISEVVRQSGYRLKAKKTRVAVSRPSKPVAQQMLGMTINEKANVPRHKRLELRQRVHRVIWGLPNRELQTDRLRAELRYWVRIAPMTIQPLIDRLDGAPHD